MTWLDKVKERASPQGSDGDTWSGKWRVASNDRAKLLRLVEFLGVYHKDGFTCAKYEGCVTAQGLPYVRCTCGLTALLESDDA